MEWLANLFGFRRSPPASSSTPSEPPSSDGPGDDSFVVYDDDQSEDGNFIEGDAGKFEAATRIYFEHGCDAAVAYSDPRLAELGLTNIEWLRLTALIPVICGRPIFSGKPDSPKYASFYVVTNYGHKRVEVSYDSCPVCEGIRRAIRTIDRAKWVTQGVMSCETRAINAALNQQQQFGLPADLSKVVLLPTEVEC